MASPATAALLVRPALRILDRRCIHQGLIRVCLGSIRVHFGLSLALFGYRMLGSSGDSVSRLGNGMQRALWALLLLVLEPYRAYEADFLSPPIIQVAAIAMQCKSSQAPDSYFRATTGKAKGQNNRPLLSKVANQ